MDYTRTTYYPKFTSSDQSNCPILKFELIDVSTGLELNDPKILFLDGYQPGMGQLKMFDDSPYSKHLEMRAYIDFAKYASMQVYVNVCGDETLVSSSDIYFYHAYVASANPSSLTDAERYSELLKTVYDANLVLTTSIPTCIVSSQDLYDSSDSITRAVWADANFAHVNAGSASTEALKLDMTVLQ